jgi:hypothetical protein
LESLMAHRGGILFGPLSVVIPLTFASGAQAQGPLSFGANVGTMWYDDRSFGPPATFNARTVRPWVRYSGPAGTWDVDGRAQHRFDFYSGGPSDSAFGRTRHGNDRVEIRAVRRWNEVENLSAEGRFFRAHDLFDTDQGTILPRGNVMRWSGAVSSRVAVYEAAVGARGTRYDNDPELRNALSLGWSARLIPLHRAIDAAFIGAAGTQIDVGPKTALVSQRLSAGYRRRIFPLVTAEAEAGIAFARFSDGGRQSRPMVALGIERIPQRGAALELVARARAEGDSLAAVLAEGRYRMSAGRVLLRLQSDAEAEGGFYSDANRTTRLVAAAEDTIARANVLGIEASYARTRSLRGNDSATTLLRSTAWALRRIQPWLSFRLAASYLREPFPGRANVPNYRRIRLDAELILLSGGFGLSPTLGGFLP